MSSHSIELKRLISKYNYLQEELEHFNELKIEYDKEFFHSISEQGYEIIFPTLSSGSTTSEENTILPSLPSKFKKLFREIVSLTHPDKLLEENKEVQAIRRQQYERAVTAYQGGEKGVLIIIAIQLEIGVDNFKEEIEEVGEACKNIEDQISHYCSKSSYYWYKLKSEKEKDDFIQKFIDISLKENNIRKKNK